MYKYFIKSNRSIRHPCIVTLMGVCLFDDYQLMLVTNLIEGYNLQSIIFQKLLTVSMNLYVNPKPIKIHVLFMQLDTRSKLRISVQVAKAVSYLHSRRPAIIHQDIKPANILVINGFPANVAYMRHNYYVWSPRTLLISDKITC